MLEKLIDPISNILDKFVADKDLKQKLEHELKTELHRANMAQIEVNKEQAKHSSLFVSGARPAIMWVCCLGLFWSFFLAPFLNWLIIVTGSDVSLPAIQTEGLLTLTLSLLGLGGYRSFEKFKGVARNSLKE
ncbi:MAG: hypothetical protein CMC22_00290 [Flavobacteriaceae bacterium]|nr:hypothetical protein [Flavobacteriaceae bacterium]|tara:strand:+ start:983 stop:1378 length:396 start_codon:yes stop_codon:yes gene_type:complete